MPVLAYAKQDTTGKLSQPQRSSCLADGYEKRAYNVPFYYRHARICYVWPASVGWGGIREGLDLGFCRGVLLLDETGYLQKRNRQELATRHFTHRKEIDADLLRAYLYAAIELDETEAQRKRARTRQP